MKNQQNLPHSLFISGKTTEIKGISGVSNYSDKELCFQLQEGSLLITGNGLNMENLNVEEGNATLSGEIATVKYKKGNGNILKKLSK